MVAGAQPHVFAKSLTPRQRKYLRGLAHHIKPCVHIGLQGLTEGVTQNLSEALGHHELIKVHLGGGSQTAQAAEKRELQAQLAEALDERSHIVGRVGRIVILYREADPGAARLPLAAMHGRRSE